MNLSRRSLAALSLFAVVLATGCSAAGDDDPSSSEVSADELQGNPQDLAFGFDHGANAQGADQFNYYPLFYGASAAGNALCHTYAQWDVAEQPAGVGDANSTAGTRPALSFWLQHAQGHCGEVLLSFKSNSIDSDGNPIPGARCGDGGKPPCDAPTEKQMHDAFAKFLAINWKKDVGFTGRISFTPWNEPNNPTAPGNGLGKLIEPERAAEFYLTMANLCSDHGCNVVAGDFASNGQWPADYEWNCQNDNVEHMTTTDARGRKWCRNPSPENPGNKLPASYLDRYKDTIALHVKDYRGLGAKHRPKAFAYHGWHDANEYLHNHVHCTTYENCVTRRVLKSMGGSWGGVEIWDTEVGASQGETVTDDDQACTAAFLVRLHTLSARIKRVYYTRIHGGGGQLVEGGDPKTATLRPAGLVLSQRHMHYPAQCK